MAQIKAAVHAVVARLRDVAANKNVQSVARHAVVAAVGVVVAAVAVGGVSGITTGVAVAAAAAAVRVVWLAVESKLTKPQQAAVEAVATDVEKQV